MQRRYYNFYNEDELATGTYKEYSIKDLEKCDFLTTGEVSAIANNHCGAVAATNIAIYYQNRGFKNLLAANNYDTFKHLHDLIGDGPVLSIAKNTKRYFKSRGYILESKRFRSFDKLKEHLEADHIVDMLLADAVFNWHFVLAVGYREYESGEKYIKIITGWDKSKEKYFKLNAGTLLAYQTAYRINEDSLD